MMAPFPTLSDFFKKKIVGKSSFPRLNREKRMEMLKLLLMMVPSCRKSYQFIVSGLSS